MKSKFLTRFVVIVVMVSAIVGFSTNDNPLKINNPKLPQGTHPGIVYGPALDNPLSTLNESFEGTTFPPAGWVKISTFGNTSWTRELAGTTPLPGWSGAGEITTPVGGGSACAYITYGDVGASNNEWLITPQITNVQPGDSLSFWLRYIVPAYVDSFSVKISTTTQTVGAMTIPVFAKRYSGDLDTGYIQYKYNIGGMVPAGSNIYIGFRESILDNFTDGSAFNLDLVKVSAGAAPPVACTYTWTTQTSGTTALIYSVSAVSSDIGWAGAAGGVVRRTTDGGTTWGNGNPTTPSVIVGDIYSICAWSANDAICTTSPSATNIYKTSNGGTTWTQVYTLAGGFLDGLQMVSATEGYGMGDPVGGKWVIVKTTDGGNTWARIATEPTQVGSEAGYNNAFYILGTNMWFGTNSTKVYHSSDMGITWLGAATTGTANSFAVHYNTATNGLVSGTAMLKSTDGGTTYTTAVAPGASGSINGLEGKDNDWWAIRTGTDVYRSTNQGGTWTTAYTVAGAAFNDIDFATTDCPTGWAVGTGTIVKMTGSMTGISAYNGEIPSTFLLKQNFPNPFNPTTNINFSIPKSGFVTLKIYNTLGMEVATLVNENKTAGNYIVGFNAANLPSGTYFYRIESNGISDTKKMLLIK